MTGVSLNDFNDRVSSETILYCKILFLSLTPFTSCTACTVLSISVGFNLSAMLIHSSLLYYLSREPEIIDLLSLVDSLESAFFKSKPHDVIMTAVLIIRSRLFKSNPLNNFILKTKGDNLHQKMRRLK